MLVKIEKMKDLFDEEYIDEMLEDCSPNCCHYNAANVCRVFQDWGCIDYVEGYAHGFVGHAICSYRDANGNYHYFDPTQEWQIREGLETRFCDEFDVVETFSYDEINEIFTKDKETHLVAVEPKKKLSYKNYVKSSQVSL